MQIKIRELSRNFQQELIPSFQELVAFSGKAIEHFVSTTPRQVLGALTSPDGASYRGQEFFGNVAKNSATSGSKTQNDFSGIYTFYHEGRAMYVGISNFIIRRLRQHLFSTYSNQASLVNLLAKNEIWFESDDIDDIDDIDDREIDKTEFGKYRKSIQGEMIKEWSFSVLSCENSYYLAFSEIAVAAELKSTWNSFKPH